MKTHGQSTLLSRRLGLLFSFLLGGGLLVPQAHALEDNAIIAGTGTDAFANATEITGTFSVSYATSLFPYTAEPGEPGHSSGGGNGALHTAWWKFTAPSSAWCTVDTLRSAAQSVSITETLLSVYRGDTLATLTRVGSNSGAIPPVSSAPRLSRLTFYAEKDVTYYIAVDATQYFTIDTNHRDVILTLRHHELVSGTRDAIFCLINTITDITLGHVTITSTATGRLTGKVTTTQRNWSFTGVYGTDGYFETNLETAPIAGVSQPPIRLRVDNIGTGSVMVDQALKNSVGVGPDIFPRRRLYQGDAPGKGAYTASILTGSANTGYGYTLLQVKPTGAVTMTGLCVDGTAYTMGSHMHPVEDAGITQNRISGFVPLHKKKGGILKVGGIEDAGDFHLEIGGVYIRPPAPTSTFYPTGIGTLFEGVGQRYISPASGSSPYSFLGANGGPGTFIVNAAAPEMAGPDLSFPLTYAPPKFIFASSINKPKITLNAKTGLATGSFVDNAGVARKFKGVLSKVPGGTRILGLVTGKTRTLPGGVE